jgi:hypothetical protein
MASTPRESTGPSCLGMDELPIDAATYMHYERQRRQSRVQRCSEHGNVMLQLYVPSIIYIIFRKRPGHHEAMTRGPGRNQGGHHAGDYLVPGPKQGTFAEHCWTTSVGFVR